MSDAKTAEVHELRMENEVLREQIKAIADMIAALRPAIVDLFKPKPRERPEMLIAVQMLATGAGIPRQCGSRDCRRSDRCCAVDAAEPKCQDHWPDPLVEQLMDMAAGIGLAGLCRDREEEVGHEVMAKLLGDAPSNKPVSRKAQTARSKRGRQAGPAPGLPLPDPC